MSTEGPRTAAGDGTPGRVVLVGDGPVAARFARALAAERTIAVDGEADLAGAALVVALGTGATYGDLFDLQRRALAVGALLLPITLDADGARIGPAAVPGAGPCFACAQLGSFRQLLGGRTTTPEDLLLAIGTFVTLGPPPGAPEASGTPGSGTAPEASGTSPGTSPEASGTSPGTSPEGSGTSPGTSPEASGTTEPGRPGEGVDRAQQPAGTGARSVWHLVEEACAVARDEIGRLLAPPTGSGSSPHLLDAVLHLSPGGGRRLQPVARYPLCPLCADAEPVAGPLAALLDRKESRRVERSPLVALPVAGPGSGPTVCIVGGGTAGYLAALALRAKRPEIDLTLIESSQVPAIGVGEATTPLMPQFLHVDLGLDPGRLFRQVRPTLKLGIRFLWGRPHGAFSYPFGAVRPLDALAHDGDLEGSSLGALAMAAGRIPMTRDDATGHLTAGLGTDVAYHLDNGRFVEYLRARAAEAGVVPVDATIAQVRLREGTDGDGDGGGGPWVDELVAADGRRFRHDLYLDATGFRSLLLGDALGTPWHSFATSLPTDRAVVAALPVSDGEPPSPYTLAETFDAGWCWAIPQPGEIHRGYVYASEHLRPDEAEAELRRRTGHRGAVRHLAFRSGRHERFARANVVALGNAYGFVEPLESTALHMVIRQIGLLLAALPTNAEPADTPGLAGVARLLDRRVGEQWDYLRFFLALHYRFNRRLESPFWRACREGVELGEHGELVEAFRRRGPLSSNRAVRTAFDAPDPLWDLEGIDTLLLGQGVACTLPRPPLDRTTWTRQAARNRRLVARFLPHADALDALAESPRLQAELLAPFRAAGPAFPL